MGGGQINSFNEERQEGAHTVRTPGWSVGLGKASVRSAIGTGASQCAVPRYLRASPCRLMKPPLSLNYLDSVLATAHIPIHNLLHSPAMLLLPDAEISCLRKGPC
jgi:hypothetical protein